MTTGAKIERVGYIGWRGITGCESLTLHELMTGLVGGPGAGKSTLLMTLVYALLPDRRVMDIQPISDVRDSQASGTDTLLGRIDPQYGYAYVILEVTTRHGERLVAGIQVEAEDGKAHFKCWHIRNAPDGADIRDLMCVPEGDAIVYPDLPVLKRHLAQSGVDLLSSRSVGEYCQLLYQAGILPSPMTDLNDRRLYAKLLEATFRGGLSEEIIHKLKDYLLPPPTQLRDIVQGLQECTNEMLKTRRTVTEATHELTLLQSTYGVGKLAVRTALDGIRHDAHVASEEIHRRNRDHSNLQLTRQELQVAIASAEGMITATEELKTNALKRASAELKELDRRKTELHIASTDAKKKADHAAGELSRYDAGLKLWTSVCGKYTSESFDGLEKRLAADIRSLQTHTVEIELAMRELQAEANRLAGGRASDRSEHLAAQLGARTLQQSLRHTSSQQALEYEASLGGLIDGVVGVTLDDISRLTPSADLPDTFWLGNAVPRLQATRQAGPWLIAELADGHVVVNRDKVPAFGDEASTVRQTAIATQLNERMTSHTTTLLAIEKSEGERTTLWSNRDVIGFYLEHRSDPAAIATVSEDAGKRWRQCQSDYAAMEQAHGALADRIAEIGSPFETQLKELRRNVGDKRGALTRIERDIEHIDEALAKASAVLQNCQHEYTMAADILGESLGRFEQDSDPAEDQPRNVTGMQAKRMTELQHALGGDLASSMPSLMEVNAEDRLSIVRIWPELMKAVREIVSTDVADMDGDDLIEHALARRATLDSDLARQENELRINARNLLLNISTSVRGQKTKLEKLSQFGRSIEFGNVTGIQIALIPRRRMLDLLEQITDQPTLLAGERPIQEALNELFELQNINCKFDGDQLLDYRNYVDLVIQARRRTGTWNPAVSLSGTEAIGGGLAVALMLTRSLAARGEMAGEGVKVSQIRPLFAVDEISRLNSAGQASLVEFAQREKFQLLVTAPAIEPKYGCQLYALARRFDPDEQLIIRGVRVVSPDA
jgi:hypothetical protein